MLERIKKSKLSLKLFSVVLAIAAWLIITYTIDPSITYYIRNVPVTFTGEDVLAERGLVLTNKDEIDSVNVKVRGSRSAVINTIETISARADISDIETTGSKSEAVIIDLGSSGVTTIDRKGPSIIVKLDNLVDKQVPVRIMQSGAEKNKQTIIASEGAQKEITLRGGEAELENVSYALVSLDISGIEGDISRPLSYTLMSSDDTKVTCNTLIEPANEIMVTSHVYPRKTVTVRTVLPVNEREHWGLNVKSQSKDRVDVGIIDENTDIDTLEAVFLPGAYRSSQEEYNVPIVVPDGIYLPESSQSLTAKLALERKVEKEVTLDVEVRSAAQGLRASANTSTVNILLRGAESKLNKDNVKAYVDASGAAPGYHEFMVQIDTTEDIILCESVQVGVNIE